MARNYSFAGSGFTEEFVPVEEGVSLKVSKWIPTKTLHAPLVFAAGWVSAVSGWEDLLEVLTVNRPVYYVETREKLSARIEKNHLKPHDFSIPRMATDLIEICHHYRFPDNSFVMMGSSLGATAILEALKKGRLRAQSAFLVGPNSEFHVPWYIRGIAWLPADSYHILKHFVLWYLRNFRVDARKEPEQMKRYDDTLKIAHPQRIKLSALSAINMKYRVWPSIETIRVPVAIAFAPTDTLHSEVAIRRMADALSESHIIRCPTNRYMHNADILTDIDRFIRKTVNPIVA